MAATRVRKMLVQGEDSRFSEEVLTKRLESAFSKEFIENAGVHEKLLDLRRRFGAQVVFRYLTSLAGLALISFAIIYILAWSAMPADLAADWSNVAVRYLDLTQVGLPLSVPLTPYFEVSILFSAIAMIAYLAVSATDETYVENAGESAIAKPAEELALYFIAFLYFRDS